MANSKPVKILVLRANPANSEQLRLDEEVRDIQAELDRARYRDRFEFRNEGAVRVDDLSWALLKHKPDIVHFSGHGVGKQGLVLEDDTGKTQLVSTEALGQLFKWARNTIKVKCVFLNACYSKVQAEAIHQNIDCVIGMNQAIGDRAAIKFAAKFYQALVDGEPYQSAYDYACTALELSGSQESSIPELLNRSQQKDPLAIATPELDQNQPSELTAQPPQHSSPALSNVTTISGNNNPFAGTQASGSASVSQKNAPQSLNNSGGTISGQVGLAGGNLTQTQHNSRGEAEQQLTSADVLQLIQQLEELLKSSSLPGNQKDKATNYLQVVKEEAESKEPNKQFAAQSLQKAANALKSTNEAVDAGQNLWKKIEPILKQLQPWLGIASGFLG